MECYEHALTSHYRAQLTQVILDIIALRPTIDMRDSYFKASYSLETKALHEYQKLLDRLMENLLEKERRMTFPITVIYVCVPAAK
jgi:hypothetical protein